jgi:putative tryptophan/tyrosine transport system substrate-binding protein
MARPARTMTMPVIGFLSSQSPEAFKQALAAFHQGLKQTGYVEGENVAVEHDWAMGQQEQLKEQTADLVRRGVALIAAFGGAGTGLMAKAATKDIPIVFTSGFDPIKVGLVDKLDKRGRASGNLTGVHLATTEFGSKRLEALHELMPKAETIALLVNPKGIVHKIETTAMEAAAHSAKLQLHVARASDKSQFKDVFEAAVKAGAGGLLLSADPYFTANRMDLVALAARHAMPAVYPWREYVEVGGLMSYGPNLPNVYRQVGIYAGMILKGAKPAELPVQRSTTFDLVINLKTAKALDLDVPPLLLARADEVLE